MTAQEWAQIMGRLAALYPASRLAPESVAVYYELLRDLDAADVAAAAVRAALDPAREFMPTAARIRAWAAEEAAVRREHARLPDMTGIAALPDDQAEALLEAGYQASVQQGASTGDLDRLDSKVALGERGRS